MTVGTAVQRSAVCTDDEYSDAEYFKLGPSLMRLSLPGVNFMSQKLRGIPPGGILVLTLIDSFLHFLAQYMLTLKF